MICKWCGDAGCFVCQGKQSTQIEDEEEPKPLFTANIDSEKDMEALKRVIGSKALDNAFSPAGGGIREIITGATVESILQATRRQG